MKSGQKGASQGEPLGINFFGLSMHFPHQLGKRDGKINWLDRFDLFGAFWATLAKHSPHCPGQYYNTNKPHDGLHSQKSVHLFASV